MVLRGVSSDSYEEFRALPFTFGCSSASCLGLDAATLSLSSQGVYDFAVTTRSWPPQSPSSGSTETTVSSGTFAAADGSIVFDYATPSVSAGRFGADSLQIWDSRQSSKVIGTLLFEIP